MRSNKIKLIFKKITKSKKRTGKSQKKKEDVRGQEGGGSAVWSTQSLHLLPAGWSLPPKHLKYCIMFCLNIAPIFLKKKFLQHDYCLNISINVHSVSSTPSSWLVITEQISHLFCPKPLFFAVFF